MSEDNSSVLSGAMGAILSTEDFVSLANKLAQWRLDPSIKLMESKKSKGRILGFVKGLRFSAQVAYLIRNILSPHSIDVNWGHLIDNNGISCSPECDIIIHQPGYIQKWNGSDRPIMDFKFINCKDALGIVSCKSLTRSVDKEYCKDFNKYKMKNIFLFVECCNEKSIDRLTKQAKEAGYKGFYYLYTIKNDQYIKTDENVYIKFIKKIKALPNT
ncbi:hypothetical protein C6A36_00105 [Desulfobacteraceae bacterium SEEP-SAG10]|nr:hypothetical protein C6A36_00105 [Desulfobacteraceae bacterium SEEP-SAG10]